jgi:hypothetical protein
MLKIQGIVALTKQLKHGLYVPMVLEQTYRHRVRGKLAPQPSAYSMGGISSAISNDPESLSAIPVAPLSVSFPLLPLSIESIISNN